MVTEHVAFLNIRILECPHPLQYLVSDEGCAPPPLVGFVRTRQRISTLYSNKISVSLDTSSSL